MSKRDRERELGKEQTRRRAGPQAPNDCKFFSDMLANRAIYYRSLCFTCILLSLCWDSYKTDTLLFTTIVIVMHVCSVVSDSVTSWTAAYWAPLPMEFPRQEDWSGLPFPSPGDLLNSGIKPTSHALAGGFFTIESRGEPICWRGGDCFTFAEQLRKCSSKTCLGTSERSYSRGYGGRLVSPILQGPMESCLVTILPSYKRFISSQMISLTVLGDFLL